MSSRKKILITGATSGLGEYIARQAIHKHELLILGRDREKMEKGFPDAGHYQSDFSLISSVKNAADRISADHDRIDIVICNAGMLGRERPAKTPEGIEETLSVNYLSHFVLLSKLWPQLSHQGSRIILIGSSAASWYPVDFSDPESMRDYRSLKAYGRTKAMLMMLGQWIAAEYVSTGPGVYVVDPGTFRSGIARSRAGWFRLLYDLAGWAMADVTTAGRDVLKLIEGDEHSSGKIIRRGKTRNLSFSNEEIAKLLQMSRTMTGCEIKGRN